MSDRRTKVRGRRVVVTGASSGIGAALAGELAGRGAELVLVARSRDALEEQHAARRSRQGGVGQLCLDVVGQRLEGERPVEQDQTAEEPRLPGRRSAWRRRGPADRPAEPSRGDFLFHEEDPADTMHLVVSGHLAVRTFTADGGAALLNVLGPVT